MEQSKLHVVSGKIPHIRIESEYQLVPTLSKVGLGDLTSTEFTRIFSGRDPIAIDNVIQKAVVDVNEKGAMAAAATAAIMSIPISPIVIENPAATFDLNRPFLFLLRDAETNMILFMGRMVSPK